VILPDVNVLVYAFRREAVEHERYASWLSAALASSEIALVESVLLGTIRIVTSPRIMTDPAPTPLALRFVDALLAAPRARQLSPTAATWERLRTIATRDEHVRGPLVPDAWLAALAISHGCRLATADRGFARFEGLDWFRPVEPAADG
jgi:toxin-antitoxin system PIN domain toxin